MPITINVDTSDQVTVADFGAVGDGATDDSSSIQAAVDAGTGEVVLQAGKVYRISTAIEIENASNFALVGNGSTIKFDDSVGSSVAVGRCLWVDNCTDANFSNLILDGNRDGRLAGATLPGQASSPVIHIRDGERIKLESVTVQNSINDGIYIATSDPTDAAKFPKDVALIDCHAINCRRQGVSIIDSRQLTIRGGSFTGSGSSGWSSIVSLADGATDQIVATLAAGAGSAFAGVAYLDITLSAGDDGRYAVVSTSSDTVTLSKSGGWSSTAPGGNARLALNAGLAPRAGIDFEPNTVTSHAAPSHRGVVVADVKVSACEGKAIMFSLKEYGAESVTISTSTFSNCLGGAGSIDGGGRITFSGCHFRGFDSSDIEQGYVMKISSTGIDENSVDLKDHAVVFQGCHFHDSAAPVAQLYFQQTDVEGCIVSNCHFEAVYTAIVNYSAGLSVTDCSLVDLTSTTVWITDYGTESTYRGIYATGATRGVIFTSHSTNNSESRTIIESCRFSDIDQSSVDDYGLIRIAEGHCTVRNNLFKNSTAATTAIAISITSANDGDVIIRNNDIRNFAANPFDFSSVTVRAGSNLVDDSDPTASANSAQLSSATSIVNTVGKRAGFACWYVANPTSGSRQVIATGSGATDGWVYGDDNSTNAFTPS